MDRKQILDSLKAEMIDTLQKVLRFETVTTDALPGICLLYTSDAADE